MRSRRPPRFCPTTCHHPQPMERSASANQNGRQRSENQLRALLMAPLPAEAMGSSHHGLGNRARTAAMLPTQLVHIFRAIRCHPTDEPEAWAGQGNTPAPPVRLAVQRAAATANFLTRQGADNFAWAFGSGLCPPNAEERRCQRHQHPSHCPHLLSPPLILHPQVGLRGKAVKTANPLSGRLSVAFVGAFAS